MKDYWVFIIVNSDIPNFFGLESKFDGHRSCSLSVEKSQTTKLLNYCPFISLGKGSEIYNRTGCRVMGLIPQSCEFDSIRSVLFPWTGILVDVVSFFSSENEYLAAYDSI